MGSPMTTAKDQLVGDVDVLAVYESVSRVVQPKEAAIARCKSLKDLLAGTLRIRIKAGVRELATLTWRM